MKRILKIIIILIVIIVVSLLILPSSFSMLTVDIDTENGRIREDREYCYGLYKTSETKDTGFTSLVKKYNMETKPHWVRGTINGSDIFGNFRLCAYTGRGHLQSSYSMFSDAVMESTALDNPTSAILTMRRLARIERGRGATEFVNNMMRNALVKLDSESTSTTVPAKNKSAD